MFKIEYRNTTHDNSTIDYLIHSQSLSLEEVHMINNMKMQFWSGQVMRMQSEAIHVSRSNTEKLGITPNSDLYIITYY